VSAWQGGVLLGLTGVLIALVALTIVLAAVFLLSPSITSGATGKILAFIGLFVLPTLCIASGMSFHMRRSQQTAYCISCHSMESHGKSLYVLNASYIPAQHFQNHLVSPDEACYACHTNYTMYGPLKDKLKGLRYLYMEYVSTPPKTIHLDGTYSNLQCLHCHTGMRSFDENPTHTAIMGSLKTNRTSCISCHNTIHNASEVDHLKMWADGDAPASVAAAAAPATAEPASPATAGASLKAPTGGSPVAASAAAGKAIFDSQGCSGCHGAAGVGASGPALTHTSAQYPSAKLTAVLKTPTPQMKAAGMAPLTLNAAEMKALVSYVTGLGGTPAAAAAALPAAGSASPAPATAAPAAAAKATPATTPAASGPATPAPAGGSAVVDTTAAGKAVFDSHGCSGCHGAAGVGVSAPALTHTSAQYSPAKLTAVLQTPTAAMKAAGMVPLTLSAADMQALVSYVSSLGGTPAATAATPAAATAPPETASAAAPPAGGSAAVAATAAGKAVFDSRGCSGCHGAAGVGASAPALTHTSAKYPPAKLTAVLQAPTPAMKTAGMVPPTLSAADMQALVSYVSSLGGTSAAAPTATGLSTPAPAVPAKPESKAKRTLKWLFAPSFPH
jgi:mono/diheme cytochrome c family protein/nitrate/TMAO reductase-like tetraheme cytochrome c subunit